MRLVLLLLLLLQVIQRAASKDDNECPAWVRALTRGTAGRQFQSAFPLYTSTSFSPWPDHEHIGMRKARESPFRWRQEAERERQREARSETVLRDKQLV